MKCSYVMITQTDQSMTFLCQHVKGKQSKFLPEHLGEILIEKGVEDGVGDGAGHPDHVGDRVYRDPQFCKLLLM